MKNQTISDAYSCPVCAQVSTVCFDASRELLLIEERCCGCFADLKLSVWVKNGCSVMLSVKATNQNLQWVEDTQGNLVLHQYGQPLKAATIPSIMRNYSATRDGERVAVNVEGLKAHIEKKYNAFA